MKTGLSVLALVALFIGAYLWFSKQSTPPPAPVPVTPTVAQEDPKVTERRSLFGDDALAADVEWRDSGLGYRISAPGTGAKPGVGTTVKLNYTGRLKDGTVFDRSEKPTDFIIGTTVRGLSTGLQMLGVGGKATFFIPPSQGYGNRKVMGIPASSGLIFDVEVVSIGN